MVPCHAPRDVMPPWVRVLLFVALTVAAGLVLPLAAAFVEGFSTRAENWILVLHVAVVMLLGAALGAFVPKSSTAPTRGGRVLRWSAAGFLAALLAFGIWLLLLAG